MEEEKKDQFDMQVLTRVVALARPYKRLFIFTGLLAVVMAPVTVIRPHLINVMVDKHVVYRDLDGLTFLAILFMVALLVNVVLRYAFIYYTALLGQNVIKDLRLRIFDHINRMRLRYFDLTPIGKSTTRTINDVETINNIFTQGLITMVADLIAIVAIIAIMFYTSWKLSLICMATLPLLVIATYIFKEKVKSAFERVRSEITNMNSFLQERISGMRIVQIFNAEDKELKKFKVINREYTQANLDTILYYAVYFPVVEIIQYGTLAILVWAGAGWFIADQVSFGALVAFPMYISMLFRPVRMLADKFNTLQMGLVAANRVFDVLDQHDFIPDKGRITTGNVMGNVRFEDVSFAYDDENYVINNLDFELNAGETLAIVGSTGSGKTTIINLINRFYDIQSGSIYLDDKDLNTYKLDHLRKQVAIVLQDVFLFNGTVVENISLKNPEITREQIIEASKMIGADAFLAELPDGYDFVVNERGSNLSAGQRQLISFVRALVCDPSILVLDEATSSIDTETEQVIQYAIERLIQKRSSIIIAHRLSTIQHADKILVMDQGRAVEFGSPEELLALQGGRYRELYEIQFEEMKVA